MRLVLKYSPASRRSLLVAGAALVALAGCGSGDDDGLGSEAVIEVSASTTQLAGIASSLAGMRAAVEGVLEPNSDPHEYEPRPSDAEALIDADLILVSGGELDLWMEDLVDASGTDAPVLDLAARIESAGAAGDPDDPHWWQNPRNAVLAVAAIRDALIAADPAGERQYRERARAYGAELRGLDRSIEACIGRVPAAQRKLVSSHDALGYYADRYGIEVIGAAIPSLSTQAQASAGETAELVELIRREGVSTIFPESGVSAELERAIASDAGARIGGELWADALGPAGSTGETYLGSLRSNTDELVAGFTDGAVSCNLGTPGDRP